MPGISNDQLLDLTRTALEDLPNLEFETALNYQNYPVCDFWMQRDRMQVESGTSILRNIALDTTGNARFVRLYEKRSISVNDRQQQVSAPWVQVSTDWSIERREALRNRRPAKFVDLLTSRRQDAMLDLADLLEEYAFKAPNSSADDKHPYGLPYWLSMRGASAAITSADAGEGFDAYLVRYEGGTTSATKGGIDGSASANSKWKNYAFTYNDIDAAFVKSFRRAFHATRFKSPMMVKDLKSPQFQFRIYMGLDQLVAYEDLATKQNDNLGRDLDPFHGNTAFNRIPITYTPVIDDKDYDPIYAVNHAMFYPFIQEGDWLREDGPMHDVEQNNVMTTIVDGSFNFFCKNVRQGGFVGHKTSA